jgi:ACT domain-containing protein
MAIRNAVGRPQKFNMKTVDKLAFYIQRNYNVSDSCKFVSISRSTYYKYLKTEPLFADSMAMAQDNANKVSFNFRTVP